jgi:hypothetical protein
MTAHRIPRGIRLNNPLNLRENPGDKTIWLYERATDDDPEFEEFDIPEGGFRAAAITIRTYVKKYGVNSVRQLIQRWAPPVGKRPDGTSYTQDTRAYINVVCNALGVDADEQIDLLHWDNLFILLKTMCRHENGPAPRGWEGRFDGSWYDDSVIRRAMELARIEKPPVIEQVVKSPTAQTAAATAAGGLTIGVSEMLSIANAGTGVAGMDTMALVRILIVVLVILGSLYIINRRAKHAKG